MIAAIVTIDTKLFTFVVGVPAIFAIYKLIRFLNAQPKKTSEAIQLNSENAIKQDNQQSQENNKTASEVSTQTPAFVIQKSQALPEVKAYLQDIQNTMGIPWSPANWRSYAAYPTVMQLFWHRLRPVVASERFIREAIALSEYVYQDMADWYQPSYKVEIEPSQRHRLQRELNAFIFGNPQLLLEQLMLRRALQGTIAGQAGTTAPRRDNRPHRHPEIELLDEPAAQRISNEMPQVYQDIKRTFGIPVVNSDYQALAKYPTFFLPAWEDLKLWRERPEYQMLREGLIRKAEEALDRLHPEVAIGEREVRDLLDSADGFDTLQQRIETFTGILPELILSNAAFLYGCKTY